MRYLLMVFLALLWSATSATAQVSVGIGLSGANIGINLSLFPELVRVPGYPVYYAPRLNSNFFFYEGMYWVYQQDNWYASAWYNGPWRMVAPETVPVFILRVPVRYYRAPPVYFRGWRADAPPRWGHHWGQDWQQHRVGWDQWSRNANPLPAPLPFYQRQYSGERYPPPAQQHLIQRQQERVQPPVAMPPQQRPEPAVRRHVPENESRQRPQQRDEKERGKDRDKERDKGGERGPERSR